MKTASRILLSLSLVVFFASMTFSQVASTANPSGTSTKQTTAAPAKSGNTGMNSTCNHSAGKGTCTQGKNFVDKNGDGTCDNCGSTGKCKGSGCGKGQQNGNCCGKGNGCSQGKHNGNGCGQGHQPQNGCQNRGNTSSDGAKK